MEKVYEIKKFKYQMLINFHIQKKYREFYQQFIILNNQNYH